MAYVVGLTATDGCLLSGRRVMNFKSADRELVTLYLRLLGRPDHVLRERTRSGGTAYKTQFGDTRLYGWFLSVGLTPRKSLTLGAIDVPEAHLFPLLRGLLDGDGTITNKTYRADTGGRPDYFWEYLITRFCSASRAHVEWIAERIRHATDLKGYVQVIHDSRPARHPFFHLRYGKRASVTLLPLIYPDGAPCLERKRAIWVSYRDRHQLT